MTIEEIAVTLAEYHGIRTPHRGSERAAETDL